MKAMGWLLVACIAFALLKLAMVVLAITLLILLVWGAINRPREVMMIVTISAFLSLIESYPAVVTALIAGGLVACLIHKAVARH